MHSEKDQHSIEKKYKDQCINCSKQKGDLGHDGSGRVNGSSSDSL